MPQCSSSSARHRCRSSARNSHTRSRLRGTDTACRRKDFIGDRPERLARFRCRDRHRDHHALRLLLPHCDRRRTHGRSRRKSIIDQDHRAIFERERRALVAVKTLAPFQFGMLARHDGLDRLLGEVQADDVGIHHPNAAFRDGAHRILFVTRIAELSHDEDVERRMQCTRNFEAHRYAAPGQRENDDVLAGTIVVKPARQYLTGFLAVFELHDSFGGERPRNRRRSCRADRKKRTARRFPVCSFGSFCPKQKRPRGRLRTAMIDLAGFGRSRRMRTMSSRQARPACEVLQRECK